jgi:SSS family solute:Na+ symporter
MGFVDYLVISVFFSVLIGTGLWAYFRKVKDSGDFFVAGGNLPWWLAGISHHVSGYSGAVFVAYAALAYTHGISVYVWWALTIFTGLMIGSFFMAPAWVRLRIRYHIQSPTEYLFRRYNRSTQQLIAWSGVILKLFDIAAKWAAIAILLNGFTGLPVVAGILLAGGISLIYISLGGIWADVWNDLFQFMIQLAAGITMLVVVIKALGGTEEALHIWERLPEGNTDPFRQPYGIWFVLTFLFLNFLSYNGGTWNLATRFISQPSPESVRKSARLSAMLYLVWPLVLFFPMWCAPLFFPDIDNPENSYARLALEFLPSGLIGLVLASMFANTLTMTSSDANTITAVLSRDIIPVLFPGSRDRIRTLRVIRITSVTFIALTIVIALNADHFGGVLGLIISWFAALIGPVSIPMMMGLLPVFNRMDHRAALLSIGTGFLTFLITKFMADAPLAAEIGSPVAVAFVVYCITGLITGRNAKLNKDLTRTDQG